MNNTYLRILAAFGGGAIAGSVTTFFITRRVVRKAEQAIADAQIASVKEHYRIIRTDPSTLVTDEDLAALEESTKADEDPAFEQQRGADFDYDAPTDATELRELAEALEDAGYTAAQDLIGSIDDGLITERMAEAHLTGKSTTITIHEESIFDKAVPESPDGKPRDRTKPYVISLLEFAQPEDDFIPYETAEINYFAGDNIMLDSQDEIMMDVNEIVGTENLAEFGRMSEDEDILYVRNERIDMVFEIHRHKIGYAESKGLNVDPDEEDHYKTRRRQRPEDPDS